MSTTDIYLTLTIERAIRKASDLHKKGIRKGDGLPYITHPYSVAFILTGYTDDEDIIAAGLLHDTVEDCGYSPEELRRDFGERIAKIVLDVSEDISFKEAIGEKASWHERKQKYLDHLKTSSQGAMLVCAADKIHNLLSMVEAYKVRGKKLWDKFNSPVDKKLWFYKEVLRVLKCELKNDIVLDLERVYLEAEQVFGQD